MSALELGQHMPNGYLALAGKPVGLICIVNKAIKAKSDPQQVSNVQLNCRHNRLGGVGGYVRPTQPAWLYWRLLC